MNHLQEEYNNKFIDTYFKVMQDPTSNKEIQLFCILDLLYTECISLHKAHELCTEYGLFSEHWMGLGVKATELWEKYYK